MKQNYLYKGVFYTSIASIFWGLPQPLFFNEIKYISALEIVSHRSIWSFIFLFLIILMLGRVKEFYNIFFNKKKIFFLSITGILITINWASFILAINLERLQDASMGYFISPIIYIVLGYIFLKEKMTNLRLLSVILMFTSIIFLLITTNTIPILAIIVALTWSFYGLIRKKIKVSSEIGLLYESGFISIFALIYLIYISFNQYTFFLNSNHTASLFLLLTGFVTIFPLFFLLLPPPVLCVMEKKEKASQKKERRIKI